MNLVGVNRTAARLAYFHQQTSFVGPVKVVSEEELDNVVDERDIIPVPKRVLRFPQSNNENGSLPPSGESSPDCEKTLAFANPRLAAETRDLIGVLLRKHAGISQPVCPNKVLPVLERVVKNVLEKHNIAYRGMMKKLTLDQRGNDMSFIATVAKEIFSDGITNWGRITSLVAFGAALCERLKESGREQCVESVSDRICSYLLTEQEDWLRRNNGWEGFVEFFHVEDPESLIRNALITFAGVAGLGAGLALLMR